MGFKERFPRWMTAVLAIAQLILTAAIIGLEIWSDYIDLAHGTIWAGLWSGIIFIKMVLMMFFITFCCRGRCCAAYVLVLNILSGALACVIIYFDQYFTTNNRLCTCYLGSQLCCAVGSIPSFQSNYSNVLQTCATQVSSGTVNTCPNYPSSKLQILQAQLGCAVGMLVTCVIYVVLYVFACFGICFGHG